TFILDWSLTFHIETELRDCSIEFDSNSIKAWHWIRNESTAGVFDSKRICRRQVRFETNIRDEKNHAFDSMRICGRCVRFDSNLQGSVRIERQGLAFDSIDS